MTDSERINAIMTDLGIKSVTKFALSIGRNRADAIYNVLRGQKITDYLARDISLYHKQYRYEWILNGKGNMHYSEEEIRQLNISPKFNNDVKDKYIRMLEERIEEQSRTIESLRKCVEELSIKK